MKHKVKRALGIILLFMPALIIATLTWASSGIVEAIISIVLITLMLGTSALGDYLLRDDKKPTADKHIGLVICPDGKTIYPDDDEDFGRLLKEDHARIGIIVDAYASYQFKEVEDG